MVDKFEVTNKSGYTRRENYPLGVEFVVIQFKNKELPFVCETWKM